MMNYMTQPTGSWAPTPSVTQPGTVSGYVHSTYEVVESGTRQVINTELTKNEAKAMARHLNMGGGFDGWTPSFFLARIPRRAYLDASSI
jgi:hypothetical protein